VAATATTGKISVRTTGLDHILYTYTFTDMSISKYGYIAELNINNEIKMCKISG
jgi:hypothetical protein